MDCLKDACLCIGFQPRTVNALHTLGVEHPPSSSSNIPKLNTQFSPFLCSVIRENDQLQQVYSQTHEADPSRPCSADLPRRQQLRRTVSGQTAWGSLASKGETRSLCFIHSCLKSGGPDNPQSFRIFGNVIRMLDLNKQFNKTLWIRSEASRQCDGN